MNLANLSRIEGAEFKTWEDYRLREAEDLADILFQLQNPEADIDEMDCLTLDDVAPMCLSDRLQKRIDKMMQKIDL